MPPFERARDWLKAILAEWWPFVSNRKAWRAARKAEKLQAERKALSDEYRNAKPHSRRRGELARQLDKFTRMELELGSHK